MKLPFVKNETVRTTTPATSTDVLDREIESWLDKTFPDLKETDKPDYASSIMPLIHRADRKIRARRILNDFEKLDSDALVKDLEARCSEFDAAKQEREQKEMELAARKVSLAESDDSDEADWKSAETRSDIGTLESWLHTGGRYKRADAGLLKQLFITARVIAPLSRYQCASDKLFVPIAGWTQGLNRLPKDYVLHGEAVRRVADQALTELENLRTGKVPRSLRPTGFGKRRRMDIFQVSYEIADE